ncbi:MAG TPA: asparagine synthase B [Longimicrobiales bacterium]|nr:asparagine synthase B [Longimicrobiales bacterium]
MCSILAILEIGNDPAGYREQALRLSRLQRHRGPDWSGVFADERTVLVHERLAIVDVLHGAQPLASPDGALQLAVNGEIYNHRELEAGLELSYPFQTASDCEVILALYHERGTAFLDSLNGIFAFVLYDATGNRYLIARDPVGVVPLYIGRDERGTLFVASELKALVPVCSEIDVFPPGHLLDSREGVLRRYHHRSWTSWDSLERRSADVAELRGSLERAVQRQLMTDVPYGALLSGGLDSSVIAALAARHAARRVEDDERSPAWWPRLHTFCIGLPDSPDADAAREVAEHIGSVHHDFRFTVQEGLDALRDVVWHLETYDVTTIRAATPMLLMARRIRAMGVKMVLSGEGADEIFGGYLYFHRAPDGRAFHEETVRKLGRLHLYDCLRANKAMAAWGVEARVPFLDTAFLDLAMSVDPDAKRPRPDRMEKHLLREAFSDILPESVAWRQKEQFSDGVGYGWIDALQEHADRHVADSRLADAPARFPVNPPLTREAYLYRALFDELFPHAAAAATVPGGASVACSTPEALEWDPSLSARVDPSGRAVQGVHRAAYR